MKHTVKPVRTYMGAGLSTMMWAIHDNLGRLIAWEASHEEAERRAAILSEPPQDE